MREPDRKRTLTTADIAESQPDSDEEIRRRYEESRGAEMRNDDGMGAEDGRMALFPKDDVEHMRSRWTEIQTGFVDEPRRSVEEADHLVAQAIQRLADSFARARGDLETQWDRGDQISTEDLRVALRRYRSFFARLLAV